MPEAVGLARSLGLKEAITLTVGTVIGVGLFTVGSSVVGTLGSATFYATLVALLVSIFPALIYGELGAAMPYEGGTYQYATRGINNFWGMQAGWSFVISLIAVASAEALAFSFYLKTLFEAIGLPLNVDDRIIAVLAVSIFIVINWRGVKLSGKLQNAFMFFFWGVAIVWFISMWSHLDFANYQAVVPLGAGNLDVATFIAATGLVWWCFAGFETCCSLGSEIKHPQVNIPRALLLAPFIVFIVTASFQWFLIGIVPPEKLAMLVAAEAPYAEAMKQAGILGFPLIMLCLGITIGGNFSTLNPSVAAPARYLFSMAKDGVLPAALGKLHPRFKTPHVAVAFMGVVIVGLISTKSIIYIASLSLFADLFYYVIGLVASIFLRWRYPDMPRPFKAPMAIFGAVFSVLVYLILMSQLDRAAFISGFLWCVLGGVIYFARSHKRTKFGKPVFVTPEAISPEDKRQLDAEFKIWASVVFGLFAVVVIGYLISAYY
ncbi:MAG: APC family permease [Neisseriaceae bacterium]